MTQSEIDPTTNRHETSLIIDGGESKLPNEKHDSRTYLESDVWVELTYMV